MGLIPNLRKALQESDWLIVPNLAIRRLRFRYHPSSRTTTGMSNAPEVIDMVDREKDILGKITEGVTGDVKLVMSVAVLCRQRWKQGCGKYRVRCWAKI